MRVSFKGSHQYQFLCFGGREKWEESKRCAQEINNSQKAVTWRRKPPTGYYFPAPRSSTFVSELTKHISANLQPTPNRRWTSFSSCFSYFNIHMHQECMHQILMQCLLVNYLHDNKLVNPSKIRYFSVNQMGPQYPLFPLYSRLHELITYIQDMYIMNNLINYKIKIYI